MGCFVCTNGCRLLQGLIFMLQALGGGLISKDLAMRELPFTVNVTQELEKIEVENMRQALLGSLTAYTQAIPAMATQGADASDVVRKIAAVIKARQKGVSGMTLQLVNLDMSGYDVEEMKGVVLDASRELVE